MCALRRKVSQLRQRSPEPAKQSDTNDDNIYSEIDIRNDDNINENVEIKRENTLRRPKPARTNLKSYILGGKRQTTRVESMSEAKDGAHPTMIECDSVVSNSNHLYDDDNIYVNLQPCYTRNAVLFEDLMVGQSSADDAAETEQTLWHTLSPEMNAVRLNMFVDNDLFDFSYSLK